MDYIIYKVLEEYKQITGFDNFKLVIHPEDFCNWFYEEYGAIWHPGNPDYINFKNDEAKVKFMLKWG